MVNAESINISQFANSSLDDWQHKSFKAYTQYQIVSLNKHSVLRAEGTDVASSLYKEIHIDLEKTPYLNWSWRIDTPLNINDEQSKAGDDFAARIYLIVEGKWFFWQTRAINYVWASHSQKNEVWANPFAGNNVMMIAVRSKTEQTKHWYTEKRNIRTDFKKYFADDIRFIDAIAIMSDTDNSAGSALSYYANIYFSEQ
ncbi:conserved hypothetical protein [Bathymodiolus platifrons methanotrophic gill symbiont]|nr:DUF3047 domain-containing protein [Methyloprofundus sp.]TXK97065.1 DUF3047 domain-containing protein [Methylococcaceae bacterium CS4]TXK99363.1 DUF3047 domain-containing protein [Methylococcaceae bacterium CS5]TXL05047.1 DUF3047 domain-containing protein [Methylococcaceae bacterium CS1]TXL05695.1 DUF3047 domain-containing protein [Methylococcaceae bacterium CS3]TXL09978.1 DUF3047 domain-containing protein [Methylococcaceae bacterium CS2]TXL14904.1 DUF3047 domain-containing protein [Methylo